ncbi:uncharacterized protein LOC128859078 [Anastrepha ludens]|uniref:uncharacterized protein LOC128859078 n=1 Tax=Anastrepha ludens TaxID=28586 RepID=UPI0023B1574F|nr:uncharacterized protein LOC128859078 [Anastrepha ludens]
MMKSYNFLWLITVLVLLSFYTAQTWSAYLPVVEKHNLNQLEEIYKQHLRIPYTHSPEYQKDSNGDGADQAVNSEGKSDGRSEMATARYNNNDADTLAASYIDTDEQAAAPGDWQLLPHGSYDKKHDVVAGNVPAYAWFSDQSGVFHAYENSDAYDAFKGDSDSDIDDDENSEEKTNAQILSRKRRGFDDWFIAPHTRWCGRGNSANNTYNQLGGASDADRCCRRHDYCPMFISAFSSRYELFNYRPYTLSHCNCDRRFRTCLKMNNDDASNTIGELFFNMVPSQCFTLRNERQCQQRNAEGDCIKETFRKRAYVRDNQKY